MFFFFFVTGGGHTPRAFVPRSLSENIYLFTEPLSGDPLCFSGIHQSKCTCLSHTISLGQGIFRDIASAISSWLIASQIGNGKWMGFAIYLKTISSREFFISSFRLGGKTANSVSKSNSWNVTKDVHAVIEKSSFFRSYRTWDRTWSKCEWEYFSNYHIMFWYESILRLFMIFFSLL